MTIYVNARAIIERETGDGTEILLQLRSKAGEPERWELPGGQIEPFEPVLAALEREIAEETGLALTLIHGQDDHVLHRTEGAVIETFQPLFAYQTIEGPVDSLGFFFRCGVSGEPLEIGDDAKRPTWMPVDQVEQQFGADPFRFDWLTQAAIERYLHGNKRKER